jgi:hypothetical protein
MLRPLRLTKGVGGHTFRLLKNSMGLWRDALAKTRTDRGTAIYRPHETGSPPESIQGECSRDQEPNNERGIANFQTVATGFSGEFGLSNARRRSNGSRLETA